MVVINQRLQSGEARSQQADREGLRLIEDYDRIDKVVKLATRSGAARVQALEELFRRRDDNRYGNDLLGCYEFVPSLVPTTKPHRVIRSDERLFCNRSEGLAGAPSVTLRHAS